LQRFLLALAQIQVGLVREVRRGRIENVEVVLLVDEYAETLHAVPRPTLSKRLERQVVKEMSAHLKSGHHVSQ
jgi:hypothetical protein